MTKHKGRNREMTKCTMKMTKRKGRNREIPSRFGTEFTSCRVAGLSELIGAWADGRA